MADPKTAGNSPVPIEVEAGKSYFWCACGQSKNQPFCDGSHKDTDFQPLKWTCDSSGRKFFCTCKRTASQPFCDGSHQSI